MALRTIRKFGDEILRKKSKPIDRIDEKLLELIEDMLETMYDAQGVGLAAVQVGILKRVFVIDIGEGPLVFINPQIISTEGSIIDEEGCLSAPEEVGEVERPFKVVVEAADENGVKRRIEGEELLARAICHENDHLNGVIFTDHIKNN